MVKETCSHPLSDISVNVVVIYESGPQNLAYVVHQGNPQPEPSLLSLGTYLIESPHHFVGLGELNAGHANCDILSNVL